MSLFRVLLDTNVVLDVLTDRRPWVEDASRIWCAHERGQCVAYLSATTLTDIHYVAQRLSSAEKANKAIDLCLRTFEIAGVDRATLEIASHLTGGDFEDNVQIACIQQAQLDGVVTRDADGFSEAPCPVWSLRDFSDLLGLGDSS